MTLFVILEGQKGAGKTFIAKKLKEQLEAKNLLVTYFDEESIINECLNNKTLRMYDLYGLREHEYLSLLETSDVILIEKSFITNVVYHLGDVPDQMITDFIEYELGHYFTDTTSCQIYVLFRTYEDLNVDMFLGVAHYLLETYNIDISCLPNSQDDMTENLLQHIMTRIELEID